MDPRTSLPNLEPGGDAPEQPTGEMTSLADSHDGYEEAFEAVILRLDGAAAEVLFRMAGRRARSGRG